MSNRVTVGVNDQNEQQVRLRCNDCDMAWRRHARIEVSRSSSINVTSAYRKWRYRALPLLDKLTLLLKFDLTKCCCDILNELYVSGDINVIISHSGCSARSRVCEQWMRAPSVTTTPLRHIWCTVVQLVGILCDRTSAAELCRLPGSAAADVRNRFETSRKRLRIDWN